MGKLDELRRTSVGNIDESMGAGRPSDAAGIRGVYPPSGPRSAPARLQGITRSGNAAEIPVDKIEADPDQPREEFDEAALERLADSLKTRGQLQPIRVRWDEDRGRYLIVCGERRWRAARRAGMISLSCVISEGPIEPGELLALQLIENCVREDLKPIEQARAYRVLMERNGWSGSQVARALGIAQPSVVRALAMLDLPTTVQEKVEQGALTPATAYEVAKLDDPEVQERVAARVVAEGLTRDQTIEVVRRASQGRGAIKAKGPSRPQVFRTSMGKVTVEPRKNAGPETILEALLEAVEQARRAIS
jgi:ParB family chromosome partitioning protein